MFSFRCEKLLHSQLNLIYWPIGFGSCLSELIITKPNFHNIHILFLLNIILTKGEENKVLRTFYLYLCKVTEYVCYQGSIKNILLLFTEL